MRRKFEVNPGLSITPIESVKLPLKSRDELPAILSGLQWIFSTTELNEDIFKINLVFVFLLLFEIMIMLIMKKLKSKFLYT